MIKDSGSRTEFPTGAVRDMGGADKGRCDLLPLDVVAVLLNDGLFHCIGTFKVNGDTLWLEEALNIFREVRQWEKPTMILEVSKHFAEGCEKYGENNWMKGIPVKSYINSGVRHYLKWLRGDEDERHDRAFVWNIMCAIWTCKHRPELNDYGFKNCPVCGEQLPREAKFCDNCRVTIEKTGFDPDDFMGEFEEENG